ncbi:MAG: gephyrin-like molybdotransferase Glp [Pseudomonadota bacterium]|nr:gephyrin-like molybdotransferase Glp [Pseudomonadota bacterium]
MAQLSDDCFAFGGELMRSREALQMLNDRLNVVVGVKNMPLRKALGQILAEDVISEIEVPPHDNAAVDGYAVRFADLSQKADTELLIAGRLAAGDNPVEALRTGQAIRIFTGASMPLEADTVLMQEDCRVKDDVLIIPRGVAKGANRRLAGENIKAGMQILHSGLRLRPQDIGMAASVGKNSLPVYDRVRVALFSTGDEVRDIGQKLPNGCIYDANRYMIASALERLGCIVDDLGILPDSHDVIKAALAKTVETQDLIMTSGGVSTGEEDHVRSAVEALGELHFWRLAIRPGRPLALGQIGSVPFIGLPGNPVAVLVTFMLFARPAILRLGGCRKTKPEYYQVRAGFELRKKSGRREWLRVHLEQDNEGFPVARKFPRDGAGILMSMVESDGLVELPEDLTLLEADTMVNYLPFNEIG